jgi:hypothetical protein
VSLAAAVARLSVAPDRGTDAAGRILLVVDADTCMAQLPLLQRAATALVVHIPAAGTATRIKDGGEGSRSDLVGAWVEHNSRTGPGRCRRPQPHRGPGGQVSRDDTYTGT